MKRFGNGASNLGKRTPTSCAVVALAAVTNGIWMRVYLKINGKTHYLWRAVDQDGNVLDILVHSDPPSLTAMIAKNRQLLTDLRQLYKAGK